MPDELHVVVVGAGFAGVGCTRRLAGRDGVRVTLIDRHNYHQFQPLLYQVATSQLASSDVAFSLRKLFHDDDNVDVKMADVASVDASSRTVTTTDGQRFAGDALVLAAGSQPNFFRTSGAEDNAFPLYSLDDAQRLRSRIIGVFEDADRDPALLDEGALNFVIVGGGATGVEIAGALADLVADTMSVEYRRSRRQRGADPHRRSRSHAARPVLRACPRLRGQGARAQGRAHAPRRSPSPRSVPDTSRSPTARSSGLDASSGAAASWRRPWPARRSDPGSRRPDRRARGPDGRRDAWRLRRR